MGEEDGIEIRSLTPLAEVARRYSNDPDRRDAVAAALNDARQDPIQKGDLVSGIDGRKVVAREVTDTTVTTAYEDHEANRLVVQNHPVDQVYRANDAIDHYNAKRMANIPNAPAQGNDQNSNN